MSKKVKLILPVLLIFTLSASLSAALVGGGEVTGEVMQSWLSGERVVFYLDISKQRNDGGPKLANPNRFVYDGTDKMEVTEGDVIKLYYFSDDSDGIIVKKLEFADNRPGSVEQSKTLSLFITLGGILFGVILIVGGILYQKRRRRVDY